MNQSPGRAGAVLSDRVTTQCSAANMTASLQLEEGAACSTPLHCTRKPTRASSARVVAHPQSASHGFQARTQGNVDLDDRFTLFISC